MSDSISFLCWPVVLVTWTSRVVLTIEGSRAPSADTEVVMPLFCRSMLRLRTGPRGGCSGLAEAERGHRWHSGKGHSHRRARGAQPMGGVISGRVGRQSSTEQMDRRINRVKGKREGKWETKRERKEGRMMVERNAGECFYQGTRAQKKRFVRYSTLGRQQLDFWSFNWAVDYRRHEEQRATIPQNLLDTPQVPKPLNTTWTNLNTKHHSTEQHSTHHTKPATNTVQQTLTLHTHLLEH